MEILSRPVLIYHVRDWREGRRKGHLSWLLGLVLLSVNYEGNHHLYNGEDQTRCWM